MDPELQKSLKKLVKWAIFVMILLSLYLLFTYLLPTVGSIASFLPSILLPFILAILLAIIIEPVVNVFEVRFHLKRIWAVIISLILVLGSFIVVITILTVAIIREMTALYRLAVSQSDVVISDIMTWFEELRTSYLLANLPAQLDVAIQESLQKAIQMIQQLMDTVINGLMQGFALLPGILIFIGFAAVATFLIVKDRALIRTFIISLIPSAARSHTIELISELIKALSGFIKAYAILITITTIITMIALKLLGAEYAFLIGIIVGLFDVLPILGPGAIMIPWSIWNFIIGDIRMGISLLVIYTTISVVRQFLEPQILGDSIGLHPLATLVSLYVGLQLGGIVGMIMGPVLVVIFIACYRVGLFDRFDWRKERE